MKPITTYILLLLLTTASGQIGNYNHFPALPPAHILDDDNLTEDINFAYSLRLLRSDYEGALIRLRRASDNAEQDFFCGDDDRIDIDAINTFKGTSNVFVTVWYDQSTLGINAIQTIADRQPRLIPDTTQPYFAGDGANDSLIVQSTMAQIIENGKNGSVAGVFYATDRADSAFGAISGSDRWLVHINWSNERCFFDPGYCCNGPRSFVNNLPTATNPGSLTVWDQYSFIRRDDPAVPSIDRTIMRLGGVQKVNGDFPDSQSYAPSNNRFTLGAIGTNTTNGTTSHSDTRFAEMIMWNRGKEDVFIQEIENNQIAFWNL